jgi:hypothetical protein
MNEILGLAVAENSEVVRLSEQRRQGTGPGREMISRPFPPPPRPSGMFAACLEVLQRIMRILDPPSPYPAPPPAEIGFHVKEDATAYHIPERAKS